MFVYEYSEDYNIIQCSYIHHIVQSAYAIWEWNGMGKFPIWRIANLSFEPQSHVDVRRRALIRYYLIEIIIYYNNLVHKCSPDDYVLQSQPPFMIKWCWIIKLIICTLHASYRIMKMISCYCLTLRLMFIIILCHILIMFDLDVMYAMLKSRRHFSFRILEWDRMLPESYPRNTFHITNIHRSY